MYFSNTMYLKFSFRVEFRDCLKSLHVINNLFKEHIDFNHQIVKMKTFFGQKWLEEAVKYIWALFIAS